MKYLYIISSSTRKGEYKVGYSTQKYDALIARYKTYLMNPKIEYTYPCNGFSDEKRVHKALSQYRIYHLDETPTEWFECPLLHIIDTIYRVFNNTSFSDTYEINAMVRKALQNVIEKNPPPQPKIIDKADYDCYSKFVDENWDGKPDKGISHYGAIHIYNRVWCKDKIPILNMRAMKNGGEMIGDEFITSNATAIKQLIVELFKIGGQNFEQCLQKKEIVTLRYDTSSPVDGILKDLAKYYNLAFPSQKWKWLGIFLSSQLLLSGTGKEYECKATEGKSSGKKVYKFDVDMTDWIGYHIK